MQNFLLTADVDAGSVSIFAQLMPFVLIGVVFYFMLIRPQKKREKQVQEMRSRIDIGDEVITVGGIIGIVVSAKEDHLVIETGSDRSKLRITRWAVQSNNTPKEELVTPEVK